MLFTDAGFWAFFVLVFAAVWALPGRFRWAALLLADIAFYLVSGSGRFLLALTLPMAASFGAALWLQKARAAGRSGLARLALALGVGCSLGCLAFYKLLPPALTALGLPLGSGGWGMPLGISYFTLQNISYLADVARGSCPAHRHFGRYAVSVSFFVLLLTGPIERPAALLPQLEAPAAFDARRAEAGVMLVVWGLYLKLTVANILGSFVDVAFDDPAAVTGVSLLIAAVLYAWQIYTDFAGFSNIARGAALLLGLQVTQNFRQPYFARDIRDFWSRWHISLSGWLRDYVYIPLGGSRHGMARTLLCLALTFVVSGLWHGAGVCFMVWGLLHGLYQCAARLLRPAKEAACRRFLPKPPGLCRKALCSLWVFGIVTFAWVFFRVGSGDSQTAPATLATAFGILSKMAADFTLRPQAWKDALVLLRFTVPYLVRMTVLVATVIFVDIKSYKTSLEDWAMGLRPTVRLALGWAVLVCVLLLGADTGAPIYFQF